MRILGIDPGTSCGWALIEDGKLLGSGAWDLKPSRKGGDGTRFLYSYHHMKSRISRGPPIDAVYFEQVRRHRGTAAAHVYGGLVAILKLVCEQYSVPYIGIAVGTIKKHATGKGNANKAGMMAAARARFPGIELATDDEADAIWVAMSGGGWE